MVEIRYGDKFEVSELAGQTVSEAREQFKAEFGIPNKAQAKLNGSKIKSSAESDTVLNDDDKLTFAVARSKGVYLVGALLLALAITGGIFAAGWINNTTSITATVGENFANVYVANNVTGWTTTGNTRGEINPGSLFRIEPAVGYGGDLVISVGFGNAGALSEQYRVLSLQLALVGSDNVTELDISAGNGAKWTLLTLNNGAVDLYPVGATQNMTVRVKGGFYITQAKGVGAWGGASSPELFCEVSQRGLD